MKCPHIPNIGRPVHLGSFFGKLKKSTKTYTCCLVSKHQVCQNLPVFLSQTNRPDSDGGGIVQKHGMLPVGLKQLSVWKINLPGHDFRSLEVDLFFHSTKTGESMGQIFIKIQFIWLIFVLRTEKNESRNRIDFHHIDLSWDWFLWWVGWLGAWPLTTPKDPGETWQNWSHHLEVWLRWAGGVFHSSCANCLRGNVWGRIFLRPICKD